MPLVASNLTGLAALRALAQVATFEPMTRDSHEDEQEMSVLSTDEGLDALVYQLATQQRGVILTMGKGGVGKTTVAAALALALAKAGHRVHLSTTDTAAHLDHTVGTTPFPHLTVSRIDPLLEIELYTQEVLSAAGPLDGENNVSTSFPLRGKRKISLGGRGNGVQHIFALGHRRVRPYYEEYFYGNNIVAASRQRRTYWDLCSGHCWLWCDHG
ncbi:ArsA-related P-loop ATPase [Ktedonobacter racemifer]|uniref:ArsA-related P-loop ATPase n=1 Tax=Ktedonobacter racemifer TaxID=363277 RepID=UPI00146A589B|nr:ArsA-related P-loop ATPase [Ktedonobacter racemifer]